MKSGGLRIDLNCDMGELDDAPLIVFEFDAHGDAALEDRRSVGEAP